tara:strand:- start:124 stop:291 length:168 start_codon:yes stop_codon:yes gene_type:complete
VIKYEISFKDSNLKPRILIVEVDNKKEAESWMALLKKMNFATNIVSCKRKEPKEE